MLPFPDSSDLPQVPLEIASEAMQRIQTLITEVRRDGYPDGIVETLEREFSIKKGCEPSEFSPETIERAAAYLATKTVEVPIGELNTLLVFIGNVMERIESTLRFAEYLHSHDHEGIGRYLSSLVTFDPIE